MIIYNTTVIFLGCFGMLCGLGGFALTKAPCPAFLIGFSSVFAADLYLRIREGAGFGLLLEPDSGGHIWFIPVWLIALVTAIIIALMWMGVV